MVGRELVRNLITLIVISNRAGPNPASKETKYETALWGLLLRVFSQIASSQESVSVISLAGSLNGLCDRVIRLQIQHLAMDVVV
jgi:hypothetical protein